jgi:CheY-like chemotaxis protein
MDLGLPLIDGHEATRLLRETAGTRRIPVIALTAHAMDSDRDAAMAAGCDAFETKPVVMTRLVAAIETLLTRGTGAPRDPQDRTALKEDS